MFMGMPRPGTLHMWLLSMASNYVIEKLFKIGDNLFAFVICVNTMHGTM